MGTPARLLAFAAALAAVFGLAVAAGAAFGPEPDDDEQPAAHGAMFQRTTEDAHGAHAAEPAEDPHGGAAAGSPLAFERVAAPAGRFAFRLTDTHGTAVRDFDVEHTKRLHLVIVRRDLSTFAHLHPAMAADGTWSTPLRLPQPGAYRVYADVTRDGEKQVVASDLLADGDARYTPLPPARRSAQVDGYTVALDAGGVRAGEEALLRFSVTRGGRTVTPQSYLGAAGHLVAISEGSLEYLHTHPERGLQFATTFPEAGAHRLFLQFRDGGRVHTAAFTVEVPR